MNIYKFFKSQDVASYCKKTRNNFSPLEKAVLISRSSQPIEIKHWLAEISNHLLFLLHIKSSSELYALEPL